MSLCKQQMKVRHGSFRGGGEDGALAAVRWNVGDLDRPVMYTLLIAILSDNHDGAILPESLPQKKPLLLLESKT